MTVCFPARDWSMMETMMEAIGQPAFLVKVGGKRDFTFQALNAVHCDLVGLDPAIFVGKKPGALLPPRLAETLIENYEHCRASAHPYSYEENLSLPNGARWWHTTLSPICDASGTVTLILGIAIDITGLKEDQFKTAETLSASVQKNRELLGYVSRNVDDVRGPFQSVLGIISVVKEGFVDLGDGKLAQLDLCNDIANTALAQVNAMCQSSDSLIGGDEAPREVDLGHMCRDIVAMIDPDRRFAIRFPTCKVVADQTVLELLLRKLLENAAKYAIATIVVDVSASKGGGLCFRILDDGLGEYPDLRCDGTAVLPAKAESHDLSEIGRAHSLIESREGCLSISTDAGGLIGLAFTIGGTLAAPAAALAC